jgi:hypothetical protein
MKGSNIMRNFRTNIATLTYIIVGGRGRIVSFAYVGHEIGIYKNVIFTCETNSTTETSVGNQTQHAGKGTSSGGRTLNWTRCTQDKPTRVLKLVLALLILKDR